MFFFFCFLLQIDTFNIKHASPSFASKKETLEKKYAKKQSQRLPEAAPER